MPALVSFLDVDLDLICSAVFGAATFQWQDAAALAALSETYGVSRATNRRCRKHALQHRQEDIRSC